MVNEPFVSKNLFSIYLLGKPSKREVQRTWLPCRYKPRNTVHESGGPSSSEIAAFFVSSTTKLPYLESFKKTAKIKSNDKKKITN